MGQRCCATVFTDCCCWAGQDTGTDHRSRGACHWRTRGGSRCCDCHADSIARNVGCTARGNAESRFENFDRDFHERLRQAFLDIAKRNPDRCTIIDAAADEEAVAAAIWTAVARRFGL